MKGRPFSLLGLNLEKNRVSVKNFQTPQQGTRKKITEVVSLVQEKKERDPLSRRGKVRGKIWNRNRSAQPVVKITLENVDC